MIALLADAEAGKVKRVFVYKFDRLGRAADTHLIAQQLEDAGVELVSVTEGTLRPRLCQRGRADSSRD